MGCMEEALPPDPKSQLKGASETDKSGDVIMVDAPPILSTAGGHSEFLFRCLTCKRLAHYEHLTKPESSIGDYITDIAQYYQKRWLCHDCLSFVYPLDLILAWRPYPPNAIEPPRDVNEPVHYKSRLPREYLVKWQDRSYRRTSWVPHMWLVSTHPSKLNNFLTKGPNVDLTEGSITGEMAVDDDQPSGLFAVSRDPSEKRETPAHSLPNAAVPDAEDRIPLPWKTVDRVLDVLLWRSTTKKQGKQGKGRVTKVIESDEEDEEDKAAYDYVFESGEQPDRDRTETLEHWEKRTREKFSLKDIDKVVWAFIKWEDLGYDNGLSPFFPLFLPKNLTRHLSDLVRLLFMWWYEWTELISLCFPRRDAPPLPVNSTYPKFKHGLTRFIAARAVPIPKLNKSETEFYQSRPKDYYKKSQYLLKSPDGLALGQAPELQLMPFQVRYLFLICNFILTVY